MWTQQFRAPLTIYDHPMKPSSMEGEKIQSFWWTQINHIHLHGTDYDHFCNLILAPMCTITDTTFHSAPHKFCTQEEKNLAWLLHHRLLNVVIELVTMDVRCDSDVVALHWNWCHCRRVNLLWLPITEFGSVFDITRICWWNLSPC